jgi:hypothetical protein
MASMDALDEASLHSSSLRRQPPGYGVDWDAVRGAEGASRSWEARLG